LNEFYLIYLKTPFKEFDQAVDAVREGHYWGVAAFRFNFSQAVINKSVLFDFISVFDSMVFLNRLISFKTDSATLNASSVHLYLDMTSKIKPFFKEFIH